MSLNKGEGTVSFNFALKFKTRMYMYIKITSNTYFSVLKKKKMENESAALAHNEIKI